MNCIDITIQKNLVNSSHSTVKTVSLTYLPPRASLQFSSREGHCNLGWVADFNGMGLMKALASLVGSCMVIAVASKRSFKFDDINIGDVVMRGVDWQWGDQDGGEGETGVVVEITRWKVRNYCRQSKQITFLNQHNIHAVIVFTRVNPTVKNTVCVWFGLTETTTCIDTAQKMQLM